MNPKKKWHCWICEKNKAPVSKAMHEYVMDQIKIKARYYLAFRALCVFLVGKKKVAAEIESNAQPDFNGRPQQFALHVLAESKEPRE